LICDRQAIPTLEPKTLARAPETSAALEELPGLLAALVNSAPEACRNDCLQLSSLIREQMLDTLRSPMRSEGMRELSEAERLLEQNEILMRQLVEKKEEAGKQKAAALHEQQGLVEQLRKAQKERDTVQARVNAKEAELKRLRAACQLQQEHLDLLMLAQSEPEIGPIAQTGIDEHLPIGPEMPATQVPDLSALAKELDQALAVNQQLREELAAQGIVADQEVSEFRGIMAVFHEDEDDEDDGVTPELQEQIIEDAYRALDVYKHGDCTNEEEFGQRSIELIRSMERVVGVKVLKDERMRKLKNRIAAIKNSVITCKSALMDLIGDDLAEMPT
jgi:hypothetical protein